MDGAPVFSMVRNGMCGCRITAVSGILNSTTNFVLDGLRSGISMEEAIRRAQKLGIAEADPGHDLDGWDCAVKLTILANVLMDADLTPESVRRVRFDQISPDLIRNAARSGTFIRQVGTISVLNDKVTAEVSFQTVSGEEIFAHVRRTSSLLRIETDCMCPQLILQEDPGLQDTAYGIINDLMTISGSNMNR
jgi:homoserine dehydrogenase